MDERVERTIKLMEDRLGSRLRIPQLAAAVGLSVTQLSRLFRTETGRTPGAFLHELRMARAFMLVEHTSLSIAEIRVRVGIADRSHFARDFRRAHGFSPRTTRIHLHVSTTP